MAENPEDINFPATSVARIIKDALPEGVNVSKEAKGAIGRAASVFILYATTCANNHTIKGKRKTITPIDILQAVEDMEFSEFTPELKECLEAFKKAQKDKKEAAADRKRKQQQQASSTNSITTTTTSTMNNEQTSSVQEPVTMETSVHDNSRNIVDEGNESQEEMEVGEQNSLITENPANTSNNSGGEHVVINIMSQIC